MRNPYCMGRGEMVEGIKEVHRMQFCAVDSGESNVRHLFLVLAGKFENEFGRRRRQSLRTSCEQ